MQSFKRGFVLFCSLLFLVLAGNASGAQMTPKVDNFFFLYDGSGSMRGGYQALDERKAVLAKEAMQTMNGEIPALDYTAGLFTVTPGFVANLPMTDFPNPAYGETIADLAVPTSI